MVEVFPLHAEKGWNQFTEALKEVHLLQLNSPQNRASFQGEHYHSKIGNIPPKWVAADALDSTDFMLCGFVAAQ